MDASNMQAMAAAFRLFDFKMDPKTKLLSETTVVREALCNAADYPTWLYINCAHRFFRIFWLKGRTPLEKVQDAAYVIMLLGFWKRDFTLRSGKGSNFVWGNGISPRQVPITAKDVKSNFIAMELFRDTELTCMNLILGVNLFRTHYNKYMFILSRMSSKYNEYLFQALRCVYLLGSCHSNAVNSRWFVQFK